MGFGGKGGLENAGAPASNSPTFSGTVTALKYVSTQISGSDGFVLNTAGARLHFSSGGASDFIQSNGAADVSVGGSFAAGAASFWSNKLFAQSATGSQLTCRNNGSAFVLCDADTQVMTIFDGSKLTIGSATGAYLSVLKSDNTGTPGAFSSAATAGRAAIAAGASSVVGTITGMLSTSLVFITMLGVDATGLLPRVSNIAAGSFTLTVSANCTAALSFQWWVIL